MRVIEGIIREYDIECACLSMMISENKISEELFLDLKESDKDCRNILIGKIQIGNDEIKEIIKNGIEEYVEQIKKSIKNKRNILEISKDAVFILDEIPDKTKMDDYVNFVLKGTYYLVVEIPISKDNNMCLKLYKNRNELKSRFGKLNTEHPAYPILYQLLDNKINKNSRLFFKNLSKFKQLLNDEKRLCNAMTNEYFYEAISELM